MKLLIFWFLIFLISWCIIFLLFSNFCVPYHIIYDNCKELRVKIVALCWHISSNHTQMLTSFSVMQNFQAFVSNHTSERQTTEKQWPPAALASLSSTYRCSLYQWDRWLYVMWKGSFHSEETIICRLCSCVRLLNLLVWFLRPTFLLRDSSCH